MAETVIRKHYMLTMRLDLSHLDVAHLQSLAQRLQDWDVAPSTLFQEKVRNSDAVNQAYFCHNECRRRQPPIELRQEPLAYEKWLPTFADGVTALPEFYFLALHGADYIGVCLFAPTEHNPEVLESGFTGVLPAWTNRGVAKALKAYSLLCVQQHGFRYVETSNLVVNRGMCAINRSLGFQIVRKHLHRYPIPAVSEDI